MGGTREQWFHLLSSLKNLTIALLAGDEGGEAWGGWAREAGKGGEMGGQSVRWFHVLGSLKKPNNWSEGGALVPPDLAGDEGGRRGGSGPGTRARGGRWGGATREQCGRRAGSEQCGQQGAHCSTFFLGLTIGLIWLVTRGGGVGGMGQGGGQGGGRGGGGGTREQCGSNKACTGSTFWAPLNT